MTYNSVKFRGISRNSLTFSCTEFRISLVGTVFNGFALESPEKICGIEEIDKDLVSSLKTVSFSERMRRGRRRRRNRGRRRRMWTSRGRRMRSLRIGLWSHPCPVNKGSLVLPAYQETILQHIISVFVVVTKFYDLGITVLSYFNPIVYCMWKWNFCMTLLYAICDCAFYM